MPIDLGLMSAQWVSERMGYYRTSGIWQHLKQEAKETAQRYTVGRMAECLSDPVIISAVQARDEVQDYVMQIIKQTHGFQGEPLHLSRLAELCLFYLHSDFKQNDKEVRIYSFFFIFV